MKKLVILLCLIPFLAAAAGPTALSRKADALRVGMKRAQVIGLLGQASWAVLPTDQGDFELSDSRTKLELYWTNSPCNPVVVQFDKAAQATGWDKGRAFCDKAIVALMTPPAVHSCKNSDRAKLCR